MDHNQKDLLATSVKEIEYEQGEVIIEEEEPGSAAYLIKNVQTCQFNLQGLSFSYNERNRAKHSSEGQHIRGVISLLQHNPSCSDSS